VLVQIVYVQRLVVLYDRSRLVGLGLGSLCVACIVSVCLTLSYDAGFVGSAGFDPSSYEYQIRFAPGMFLPAVLDVAISTLYLCRLKRLRHETLVELPFESDDRLSRRIFARLMRIALLTNSLTAILALATAIVSLAYYPVGPQLFLIAGPVYAISLSVNLSMGLVVKHEFDRAARERLDSALVAIASPLVPFMNKADQTR